MAFKDLIPWGRDTRTTAPSAFRNEEGHPFLTLHREMNRLFDDVFSRSQAPSLFGGAAWPSIEVTPSDKDVKITAELPGLEQKDVELTVDKDVLTIRGEKKAESEDKERGFSERFYGRFERIIPLPFEVDEDGASASFENGVLAVTLPKSPHAQEKGKRIPIGAKGNAKH